MEVLAAAAGALATVAGQILCSNMKLQSNHVDLEKEMRSLMDRRHVVEFERRRADGQGQEIRAEVVTWLEDVEKLLGRTNLIPEPPQGSLNCCKWYSANREVTKIFKEITGLLHAGSFVSGVVDAFPRAVEHIPGPSIRDQTTASKALARTKRLLSNNRYQIIGIWGPAGVGKTTLVRTLNNELTKTTSMQPFGIVIWATVSKNLEMRQVDRKSTRLNSSHSS